MADDNNVNTRNTNKKNSFIALKSFLFNHQNYKAQQTFPGGQSRGIVAPKQLLLALQTPSGGAHLRRND